MRKEKWRPKPKIDYIEGGIISPPAGVASRYRAELNALIESMNSAYLREIEAFFKNPDVKEFFAMDDSTSAQAKMITNYLYKRFTGLFNKRAKKMAERFTAQSDKANKSQVNESMKKMNLQFAIPRKDISERVLDDDTRAIINENIGLIKSIGQQYMAQVNGSIMRSITNRTGLGQLKKEIEALKQVSKRRAEIIALDQTRKASQVLSRARYTQLGVEEYTWRHQSGSVEPRELHIGYDGRVFRYDTPVLVQKATRTQPEQYGFPGTAINCRCVARAVIRPQPKD